MPAHAPGLGQCWEWTGGTRGLGYGSFKSRLGFKRYRGVYAHRYSLELAHGPIPDGIQVCHHCDNRRCVRPAHLFTGHNVDNVRDMISKDRHARGERTTGARLTASVVSEIRQLYAAGEPVYALAERYSVHWRHIYRIVRRERWRHVA